MLRLAKLPILFGLFLANTEQSGQNRCIISDEHLIGISKIIYYLVEMGF